MSTSSIWSAARTTSSGTFSCCSMPVIWVTTSLRLSRCWTLTVEITVMPASRSSSTSCQRLGFLLPGVLVWASSSTSTTCGWRARTASTSSSAKPGAAVVDVARRDDLDAVEQLRGLLAAVGFDHRGDHVGAALQPAVGLAEHRERLADAGSCAEVDAQLSAFGACAATYSHAHHPPAHQLFAGYFWSSSRLSFEHVDRRLADEAQRSGRRCCRRRPAGPGPGRRRGPWRRG